MSSQRENQQEFTVESPEYTPESEERRPAKRGRVAVACTRCKTRKQKCDGIHPSCGNCHAFSTDCEYVIPTKTMPRVQYVKALEARVAELETLFRSEGTVDHGSDSWKIIQQAETLEVAVPPSDITSEKNPRTVPESSSSEIPRASGSTSVLEVLKHLSSEAGGGYIGVESSNLTVGRMLKAMVKTREPELLHPEESLPGSHLSPKSISHRDDTLISSPLGSNELSQINADVAETLLHAYLKHISTRWPILYSPTIRTLHSRRVSLTDDYDLSTLNLVYAIAGRFLETTGVTGNFFPEKHYLAAERYLESILQTHDLKTVQTLLLHAVYCLRSPRAPGAWTHIGLATRIAIELGMHRKAEPGASTLAIELRRRIFWSCYSMDRQVSIILGRPFAISDRDIDADLPLDINEDIDEESLTIYHETLGRSWNCSSLSCFIHMTRLRRIESDIQQTVYRVDKPLNIPQRVTDQFLEELKTWKTYIPSDNRPEKDTETTSYEGYDYYMIYYYKCLRLLLYPHVISPQASLRMVRKCAEACGGVCQTYKGLHRQTSVGFSLMALYSVFLSGLTLVYCIWISPKDIFTTSVNNDVNACSIVLYVITERWPGARKYRDAFESIKQYVLDLIVAKDRPRQPLENIDDGLRTTLENVRKVHPQGRIMVGDMFGDGTPRPTSSIRREDISAAEYFSEQYIGFSAHYTSDVRGGPQVSSDGIFMEDMQIPPSNGELSGNSDMEEFLAHLNPMGLWP